MDQPLFISHGKVIWKGSHNLRSWGLTITMVPNHLRVLSNWVDPPNEVDQSSFSGALSSSSRQGEKSQSHLETLLEELFGTPVRKRGNFSRTRDEFLGKDALGVFMYVSIGGGNSKDFFDMFTPNPGGNDPIWLIHILK